MSDDGAPVQPPNSTTDAASLAQATARLRQARDELKDHRYEHSVATCRRVLEIIGRLVDIPAAGDVFKLKAAERTQEQRWAAIYYGVLSLASAAHHDDEVTTDFFWSRPDAEAVLAATAGLLARFIALQ